MEKDRVLLKDSATVRCTGEHIGRISVFAGSCYDLDFNPGCRTYNDDEIGIPDDCVMTFRWLLSKGKPLPEGCPNRDLALEDSRVKEMLAARTEA